MKGEKLPMVKKRTTIWPYLLVAPAVLIEHAFHTNKEDVENLKSDVWRDLVAVAEARGIADYLGIAWVPGETRKLRKIRPHPPRRSRLWHGSRRAGSCRVMPPGT